MSLYKVLSLIVVAKVPMQDDGQTTGVDYFMVCFVALHKEYLYEYNNAQIK